MLDPALCRQRQQRLLQSVAHSIDAVVVASQAHVYYLSGYWTDWKHQSALVIFSDGRSTLIPPNTPAKHAAADDQRPFEANWFGTLRQEQSASAAKQASHVLRDGGAKLIGIDASAVNSQLLFFGEFRAVPIDDSLHQLRRVKDADELALMSAALTASEAMYHRAKEIVAPGVEELHVYSELHATAVKSLGEPMTVLLGNDFACGAAGGPPRAERQVRDGELYVLDLGPAYRGYFADSSRTFAVNRRPTDAQYQTWLALVGVFAIVESLARPSAKCRDLCKAVDEHLQATLNMTMPHHLGHGIGLYPHEFPHINAKWDDTLLEGEIFTIEPGRYDDSIGGGMRLENIYLVTGQGAKNLLNFPLDLD